MKKKTALLVGCNYKNSGLKDYPELNGCHNDVHVMRAMLIDVFGFNRDNIQVFIDKPDTQDKARPTSVNIRSTLYHLISQLQKGDVLFFHFSGHGTRFQFGDKLAEAIVPCDGNLITNMDFRMLVDQVPQLATFVFFSDSCHSGGLIDKEKEQIGPSTSPRNGVTRSHNYKSRYVPIKTVLAALPGTQLTSRGRNNMPSDDVKTIMESNFGSNASVLFRPQTRSSKPLNPDQGILLSACQSEEYAQEYKNSEGRSFGAFTTALQLIVEEKLLPQPITVKQLVMKTREIIPTKILKSSFPPQHPCLYCTDENVDRNFLSKSKSKNKRPMQQQNQRQPQEESYGVFDALWGGVNYVVSSIPGSSWLGY